MENKILKKSKTDKIIFGVAGGLANYFSVDPVIVRILFIVLAFADGVGLLLYIILAIIMPSADATPEEIEEKKVQRSNPGVWRNMFGALLIAFGIVMIIEILFPIDLLSREYFWPIVIVIIGFYLIFTPKISNTTEEESEYEQ